MSLGRSVRLAPVAVLLVALLSMPVTAQTPKSGGVLTIHPLSAPPSLSPHEESTIATVQPASACYNNLIYFEPGKKQESESTIIPELAERWSWQDGHRNLVFLLRRDVKWHDGKPFTAQDVKYTSTRASSGTRMSSTSRRPTRTRSSSVSSGRSRLCC
jgi:peptide/nickel transport system substrate-binding protein